MVKGGGFLVAASLAAGCTGSVTLVGDGGGGGDAESAAQDASGPLDGASAPDGSGGSDDASAPASAACLATACKTARSVLSCGVGGGVTEVCLSDTNQCPGTTGPTSCVDLCAPGEIGLLCGAIGPAAGPDAPASCRSVGATPAGISFACCPGCDAGNAVDDGASDAASDHAPEATVLADASGPPRSDSMPPSQSFVYASVQAGALVNVNDSTVCAMTVGLMLEAGNATQPLPVVVTDGTTQSGQPVHVTCSVDGSGSGFNIQLSATVDGMGSFYVTGSNVSPSGTTTGLQGAFTSMGLTYQDTSCVLSYTYGNGPLPAGGAPAQGRIWAHIDCEHASVNGLYVTLADGTQVERTCQLTADFLFQNCS